MGLRSLLGLVLVFSMTGVQAEDVLKAGADAPALKVDKWVKGKPIEKFEKGKIYIVEFWATWCGPCYASMPHLSEIQKSHEKDGLRVIGVTKEDPRNSLDQVEKTVEKQADKMAYTIAWDDGGKTYKAYMEAARQRGIPTSFVVDKESKIAWIGHPSMLDFVLPSVLDGTWDPKKGPKRIQKFQQNMQRAMIQGRNNPEKALELLGDIEKTAPKSFVSQIRMMRFQLLMGSGKYDAAYKAAGKLIDGAIEKKDEQLLNFLAWTIVDPEQSWKKRDLDLAMKAAKSAVKITKEENAAILDTLARVWFYKGDVKKAIEIQTKALSKAKGPEKASIKASLDEYQDGSF